MKTKARQLTNITVTLDGQAASWAKVRAAEQDMSLSRFLGELLRREMRHSRDYQKAYLGFLAEQPLRLEGRRLTREEVNDRAALRGGPARQGGP